MRVRYCREWWVRLRWKRSQRYLGKEGRWWVYSWISQRKAGTAMEKSKGGDRGSYSVKEVDKIECTK